MNNPVRTGLLILTITGCLLLGYNVYLRETTPPPLAYSDFINDLSKGNIISIHIKGDTLTGTDNSGRSFVLFIPDTASVLSIAKRQQLHITTEQPADKTRGILLSLMLPLLIFYGIWLIFHRKGNNAISDNFKRSARFTPVKTKPVTLDDVAGIGEAKQEVMEIVEFLKNPGKFGKLGAKIPKGVLLQGPPGTGKTLLAKAIAGEASVSFFSLGGSDFVEMFVGVGASRVRELFAEAKKKSPCIIFIDEIDAIGGRRSGRDGSGAGDEREQTLNALLVEMDGFGSGDNVIVVAATNRPEILDPALLRPGRFDRQVAIPLPTMKGRKKILEVHAAGIVVDPTVDLDLIARSIPGFSGADIANLVNEAALMAGRSGKNTVDMVAFEEAKDKIIMGLEQKSIILTEQERRITAYHEAGHAIVGLLLEETDPLHKITIIPRGRALGVTQQLPLDERHTYSLEYLINRIKTLLGGRAAEMLVFNRLTTGAGNDIASATDIAQRIVSEWGMSDAIGPIAFRNDQGGYLGQVSQSSKTSEKSAEQIDREIKRILVDSYEAVYDLLKKHNKLLHKFAEVLLLNETMDAEEADIVFRSYQRECEMERRLSAADNGRNDALQI